MNEMNKKTASQKEANKENNLIDKSVSDPIDEAKPASPFVDEGSGCKSFTKVNGDKFLITELGVEFVSSGCSNDKTVKVCGPLEVVSRYRDRDNKGWGRIVSWRDFDNKSHTESFSEADLAINSQDVLTALADGGLAIYQSISRGVPNRIIDFIKSYPSAALVSQRSTKSYGWFNEGEVFVLPNKIIGDNNGEQVIFDGVPDHAPKYSTKGSLKDWQENVASVAQYSSRIAFFICLAFAAPLARLVNEQSGGFHLVGDSSLGKSSALRAMCSVFASAASGGDSGEMATWRTTDNALEAVCQSHSDLPLICDELKQAEEKKLANIIYMIGNERGKGRMNGRTMTCKSTASWKLLLASSGEATVETLAKRVGLTVDNGVNVRLANISVTNESGYGIFDSWPQGDSKFVTEKLREDTESRYYGTAGIEFLTQLVKTIREEGLEKLKTNLNEGLALIEKDLISSSEKDRMVGRVCRRFALVALAGELAIEYGVLPWKRGAAKAAAKRCFDIWREDFKTVADRETEMVEHVKSFHLPNRERFDTANKYGTNSLDEMRLKDRLGVILLDGDGEVVQVYYIEGEFKKEVLEKHGFPVKPSLKLLSSLGLLDVTEKGRCTKKLSKKSANGVPAGRYIVVNISRED